MTTAERVALVTGASRGLGFTLAEFLARRGSDLLLNARDAEPLRRAAERIRPTGRSVVTVVGDVSEAEVRERLATEVAKLGRLDLLVNNASELGTSPLPRLLDYSLPELRRVLEVNLVAPLALTARLEVPLAASRGVVVNISSDAALGGYAGWGAYGASKAALDLASRTMGEELRSKGISVVSVDPGDMRTAMHQAAYPGADISDRPTPDVTIPFWAWFLGQPPASLSGRRFRAQSEQWEVPG